jgi:hypothetical protein
VGAEISIENTGTITDVYGVKIADMPSNVSGARYALYSGAGTTHFGDDLEVPVLASTPTANPPANFAKFYTKLVSGEPRLYTKDASGVEREVSGSATFPNQNANVVFAGPASGGPAAPAFRALVAADIPNLDAAKITSGVFNNARVNWAAPSAIGTTTPNTGNFTSLKANLSPYHEITTSQSPVYGLVNRRGDGPQPQFSLHRARGTLASPTAIQAGDVIGGLGWEGHDGTNYNFVAQIVAVANQNFSSGAHGTRIEFANTDDNTTNVTGRVTIHANGMLEAKVGATVAEQLRHTGTTLGFYNNTPVSRQTYGTPTGTATRTTFATSTVTLPQLAQRVKAIIDDLRAVGLFA